ncbi:MAG TPA: hypothetical protein VE224_11020 [Pseudolabrys sp.]|nr:hypothetical protein [Pseudolabrys sp.]
MHAVLRSYSGEGARQLFDVLEQNKTEIERLARSIAGFVSFTLVRTDGGGLTLSVYQDKAGTDESIQVARSWIMKHAGNTGAHPPAVMEGEVILQAT